MKEEVLVVTVDVVTVIGAVVGDSACGVMVFVR